MKKIPWTGFLNLIAKTSRGFSRIIKIRKPVSGMEFLQALEVDPANKKLTSVTVTRIGNTDDMVRLQIKDPKKK